MPELNPSESNFCFEELAEVADEAWQTLQCLECRFYYHDSWMLRHCFMYESVKVDCMCFDENPVIDRRSVGGYWPGDRR